MLGIVIPAYKRKECLREALQSLVLQTYKKFFVIVVDDHSPEPLEPVAKEFEDTLHIKYIYLPENLEKQIENMLAEAADFGISDLDLYYEDETLCERRIRSFL